jgi:hypothetical protein
MNMVRTYAATGSLPGGGSRAKSQAAIFAVLSASGRLHTGSEVMDDLPELHGSQGMGGRIGLDARSHPLVTRSLGRCEG